MKKENLPDQNLVEDDDDLSFIVNIIIIDEWEEKRREKWKEQFAIRMKASKIGTLRVYRLN